MKKHQLLDVELDDGRVYRLTASTTAVVVLFALLALCVVGALL